MNVLIITDQHVFPKEGKYYAEFSFNNVIDRYVNAFNNVTLFARTGIIENIAKSATEVKGVEIIPAGTNIDLLNGKIKKKLKLLIPKYDLLILRLHSMLAYQAFSIAKKHRIPYLAESMSCAWDGLWNINIIGKILAPYMFFSMKRTVWNAQYAAYVTKSFLQKRYPCRAKSLSASNVFIDSLDEQILKTRLKKIENYNPNYITLMTAGGLNVKFKGQQYVIKSIPLLNRAGIRVKYLLVGSGRKDYLMKQAIRYNVSDQVFVLGSVKHEEVLSMMDEIDLYVQPSLQEGLPRTVIEAMSRACPCIGAKTAGIPELINPECVFKRRSAKAIAKTIISINNKEKMSELARINHNNAINYENTVLERKRKEYYSYVLNEITRSRT